MEVQIGKEDDRSHDKEDASVQKSYHQKSEGKTNYTNGNWMIAWKT